MDPVIGVIIVGILGPLLTYIVAARKLQGSVKNSEATDLWEESRSIRQWSSERITELGGTIEGLRTRMEGVEAHNVTLSQENERLRTQLTDLQTTIFTLRHELLKARSAIETLNHELARSENSAEELKKRFALHNRRKDDPRDELDDDA